MSNKQENKMITKDEKEQIFALYWMQRVGATGSGRHEILCDEDFIPYLEDDSQLHLELKPLSSITDEDCMEALRIFNEVDASTSPQDVANPTLEDFKTNIEDITVIAPITDYLRSRGYALPAFGHPVEELVSEGIFKLIKP